ncbi:hypothetical protein [Stenotrophomonas sp. MMGLT7]|uniref:hypothetical protein n=1 Tax=Stenotrophomonas sp. MMGLT7 TaxID=2901227 RepID=UPI001E47D9BF|nr:hypothetical protein [Stenotrophomonas sp. MMGLT7]MCD7099397.1 hypothetical protein [Stenotrophomonas sp. MMGLT7]
MADDGKQMPAKIGKLVYPFKKKAESDKADAKPTAVDDAQSYFLALSTASDGFYPIGANGQWHGGIHFDAQTGATLSQGEGIGCIGNGEVVAYQVESSDSSISYSTGQARYSRSFTLVRHRLELPPAPTAKQNQNQQQGSGMAAPTPEDAQASDQKTEEPSLIFYSVYLHLMDWAGYQADAKLKRPGYWGSSVYVVGERAKDHDHRKNSFIPEGGIGLNLRDAANRCAGYAARGAQLELGAENPAKKGYFAITRLVGGQTNPADPTGLYAYKKELDTSTQPAQRDTVHVLPKSEPIQADALIGHLGQYERYVDTDPLASARPRALMQLDVFTADDVKAFIAKSRERARQLDARQKVLLKIDKGAKLTLPPPADQRITAQDTLLPVGTAKASDGWIQVRKGTLEIAERSALGTYDAATNSYPGGKIPHRFVGAQDADAIT